MKYRSIERCVGAGVFALGLSACMTNQSGNVGSTKTGDTANQATRSSPIEQLESACGGGGLTTAGAAALRRQPYLQEVTATSAKVGWISVAPDGERVELARPGEVAAFATAAATTEAVTVRTAGEHQMWAQLDGLRPSTVYCYTITGADGMLMGPIGFRTAPPADSADPVRFLAFGDSGGGGADQRMLAEQMLTVPYDLIVHTGDLAYNSGAIGEFEDNVFSIYAPLFQHLPFFPAAGNHEYKSSSAAPFRAVFSLPGTNEKWYSYDWGRVHFVALDTESDYATQASWLDADLAATAQPWKIVYFHKPPYSSGPHGSDLSLRGVLAPVFEKHGVQLVLSGHDHDYERMVPARGVQYVVTGGGGVGTYAVGTSSFTELSVSVIHFVYAEVGAEELVLHAIDGLGDEFDSLKIPRG